MAGEEPAPDTGRIMTAVRQFIVLVAGLLLAAAVGRRPRAPTTTRPGP